jgi:seryl-tRNA synthetase
MEEIMQGLGFHYRVMNMCTGDIGAPNAKKYDLEVWFPFQQNYRELVSCSNDTDFQARRLNIRYKENGRTKFVHTMNSTACAIGRTLIAIFENYQQEDGTIIIPDVLKPYLGGKEKIPFLPK